MSAYTGFNISATSTTIRTCIVNGTGINGSGMDMYAETHRSAAQTAICDIARIVSFGFFAANSDIMSTSLSLPVDIVSLYIKFVNLIF